MRDQNPYDNYSYVVNPAISPEFQFDFSLISNSPSFSPEQRLLAAILIEALENVEFVPISNRWMKPNVRFSNLLTASDWIFDNRSDFLGIRSILFEVNCPKPEIFLYELRKFIIRKRGISFVKHIFNPCRK
jgi:hypothetical protein